MLNIYLATGESEYGMARAVHEEDLIGSTRVVVDPVGQTAVGSDDGEAAAVENERFPPNG